MLSADAYNIKQNEQMFMNQIVEVEVSTKIKKSFPFFFKKSSVWKA